MTDKNIRIDNNLINHKRIQFISVYRFLAMVIVLYYHLIIIPTYSTEVTFVIKDSLEKPIAHNNILGIFGAYFYNYFHVDTGSLAVIMFFIASGYLTNKMMERYTAKEYFINRVFSTFPTLWVSIFLIAVFVYFAQGIVFTKNDFLASALLILPMSSGSFVSLVLWTLRVELKFYILSMIFWKKQDNLIFYVYILALLLSITAYEFKIPIIYSQMLDLQYVIFPVLGVLIERIFSGKIKNGVKYIFICLIINILLFKISSFVFQDSPSRMTYPNVLTQGIPVLIFLLLMKLEEKYPTFYKKLPKFVYSSSNILLPLYLTHVACGITVMYQMYLLGCNEYVILFGGVFSSFVIAYILYLLVLKPSTTLMKKIILLMRSEN